MEKYRITREEYHNEFGAGQGATFYVQQLKSFLFLWKRWVYITHEERWASGRIIDVKTGFKSMVDAENFINVILCPGKKRSAGSFYVIGEYSCNKK